MATFFISTSKPPVLNEGSSYRIDPETYRQSMLQRWPYASIGDGNLEHYLLLWELNKEKELGAPGGLQSNKMVVSFSSNPQKDAIDFVLWHRSFVPKEYPLYLFDESLQTVYELKPDIIEDDLAKIFA